MIEDKLQGKNSRDKARIKSEEISKLDLRGKFSDPNSNIKIEITDHEQIEDGIQVFAKAWRGTRKVGFGDDGTVEIERFRIFNPPVLVDDEDGDIERVYVDKDPETDEPVERRRKLRYDPAEAINQSLFHTVSLVGKSGSNIVKGKVGNTTSTFYPDANTETNNCDGRVYITTVNAAWSTYRGAAGDGAADSETNEACVDIRASSTTNQWDVGTKGIFGFNTGDTIGENDTISSATLSLYGTGSTVSSLSQSVVIDRRVPTTATSLAAGDYDISGWDGVEQSSTRIAVGSWSNSGYNDFTLNSTGIGNISQTAGGQTWYGTVASGVFDNSEPTWGSLNRARMITYFADQTGTANDPKLVVTHTRALPFTDDFDRANSDTVGNGWSETESASGVNKILSNKLRQTPGSQTEYVAVYQDVGANNALTYSGTFAVTHNAAGGRTVCLGFFVLGDGAGSVSSGDIVPTNGFGLFIKKRNNNGGFDIEVIDNSSTLASTTKTSLQNTEADIDFELIVNSNYSTEVRVWLASDSKPESADLTHTAVTPSASGSSIVSAFASTSSNGATVDINDIEVTALPETDTPALFWCNF